MLAVGALAAAPAHATAIIDAFVGFDGVTTHFTFTESTNLTPSAGGQETFKTTSTVIGGERDVRAALTSSQVFPTDNIFGALSINVGTTAGHAVLGIGIDQGAAGDFRLQYDGVDGSMGLGAGLDLDAAALGDRISLSAIYNLFIVNNAYAATPLMLTLTDMSGQSAALTRSLSPFLQGFETLNYGFADFEAANGQLDLRHIRAIELSGSVRQELTLSGFLNITGFGFYGDAYTPGNTPGGGSGPGAGVPEPATWGLMIAGFALAGTALRRRRAVAA